MNLHAKIKTAILNSMRNSLTLLILFTFLSSTCFAQLPNLQLPGLSSNGGAEFFVGRIEGKPLITVNLIGSITSQGVYHIPVQTNLTQLFSYAGGVGSRADLSEVSVRSQKQNGVSSKTYDVEKIISKNDLVPVLQDNDTIFVPTSTDTLQRTSLIIGIIGGIASIVTAVIVIGNNP